MLNRTNRTLSAKLNRLNLGTRSLAVKANGINGKVTLRARQSQGDPSRDGIIEASLIHAMSIRHPSSMMRLSLIPCSSPADPWRVWRSESEPVVAVPVAVPSPVVRPAGFAGPCRRGKATETLSRSPIPLRLCVLQVARPEMPGRSQSRPMYQDLTPGWDLGRARVRAARPAAASFAASGG
jgi:hypothetical protein